MSYQRIHQRSEFAVHDFAELVQGEADAMVGDAILRKVVGADFFGAIAGFDLPAPLGGDLVVLLLLLDFVKARAKHAHGFGAVLDLRFLVLLRDHQAAG